ncbi:MAG TPA: 30S ribosomal protein S9 [Mycobacteriales bacterium]|nr:30S ribosomal protein S9 [Mycobacteriales bacterium]
MSISTDSEDTAVVSVPTETAAEPGAVPSPGAALPESAAPAAGSSAVPTRARRREGPPQTVGRRKESVVRVRLLPGSGNFTLNGRSLEQYFPNKVHQQIVREPLTLLEKAEQFDVVARLSGGGTTGQAGALRLALARALVENDPDDRGTLKRAGFLTRDARIKERKKYGLKKARKAPQYSKR